MKMSETATSLLEREAELAAIESLLDATEGGGVIVIEGEAGAGKSSLLGGAAQMAAERKMLVLRARGGEYERDFPYGVVRQLFEPVLRERDRRAELLSGSAALAAPVFEPGGDSAEGGAIEHGLYWLTADLSGATPLLLAVDDAHWADVASLQALSYIGRRLEELPVALVVGVRTGEPGLHEELLDELRRDPCGRVIEPPPLSSAAAAELVGGEAGIESTPRFAEACRDATAGNPFLLAELGRALGSAELEWSEESVECLTRAAAAGMSSSIRTRLTRLGECSVEVARAVAVLEPNAAPRPIAELTGLAPEEVTDASERLIAAHLLTDSGAPGFVHPLIRDAVLTDLSEPRRADLHAAAARVLHGAGAEVDAVAAHLLLAAPAGDEWVVRELRSAAAAALGRGAADAAVRYLRRALLEPPGGDERPAVSRELGVALLRSNDPEGIEVLRTVRAAASDPVLRAEIANEMASSLGLRNGNEEAATLLEGSLAEIPDPDGELGTFLRGWLLAQAIWGLERVPEGVITEQLPAPDTIQNRLVLQGTAALYSLGLSSMEQARQIALSVTADPEGLLADAIVGLTPQGGLVALVLADCGDRVTGLFDLAIEGARRRGVLPGIGGGHGVRGLAHYCEGDLRDAQADAEIAVGILERFGLATPLALWSGVAVRVLLARGELTSAEALLERLWSGRQPIPGNPGAVLLCARGEVRVAAGRHAEARHDFLAAAERIAWLPCANPEVYPWRTGMAGCEAALGNAVEARAIAAEAVDLARRAGGVRGIGIALRTLGVVSGGTEGIELLAEAEGVLAGTRARLQHAEALLERGAALRRANYRRDAREPLREALELAHRCGAAPLEERARAELAATGARPRKAVFTGVESLTPSELRVARLAADGMTNREIAQSLTVTAKTVETHLRHVYQKLDIARRTELAGALGRG
jgi:DNA-binding CsgD family transcriptional regulator